MGYKTSQIGVAPTSDNTTMNNNKPSIEKKDILDPPVTDMVTSSETVSNETTSGNDIHRKAVGAGVMTGLMAYLCGGPIVGTAVGLGMGYAAEKDTSGPVGATARKVGDASIALEHKVKEEEEKHHVLENTGNVMTNAWNRLVQRVEDCCARDTTTTHAAQA